VIARCPECQTRYRIADDKVGPNGARIRCSQCSAVFRVEPESDPGAGEARILVAEPDADLAKMIAGYLRRWKVETTVVHDGGQALLFMHREKPTAAIVGARLAGLRGAELAEIVRRTAELQHIKLIRVVPDDETAASHFEADHMLEPADLPDGLAPILERLGLGTRPPTRGPDPKQRIAEPPVPTPTPTDVPPVVETPAAAQPEEPKAVRRRSRPPLSDDPEIAAAERLARIIVSDIILYNDEKFEEGVLGGNVAMVLEAELEEAGQLFVQRIPEAVRAKRPFLVEELERRAEAKRG
jgi:predicted Zn finger-like uncharacterized protein